MSKQIQLRGRIFLEFNLHAVSGLHIGGSEVGVEIGGVDKTVIRDPLTNRPYIPGSSLKGKVRSLLEKYEGLPQNQSIGQKVSIHTCDTSEKYATCDVCQVFGVPGERDFGTPTRLVVRDVQMTAESIARLEENGRTDLPYTEVKTEVSIDRVTSAANPRQMERVPAGTVFGPAELVYSIYEGDGCDSQRDVERFARLVEGLVLLEDDYLGGLGSRGSGKVRLAQIQVKLRSRNELLQPAQLLGQFDALEQLVAALPQLQEQIRDQLAQA
ncbi:type III-A CRISPR-associated RAMP protein Csm3 [Litorilinea aerophila]|uniref:CRISPR system Cms endoribonuclease Csm3 n=1 Tax=Litorilinea aerophila TaxID=1204385 RepID=A0A540VA76_9CHLR|nr:type III-A CRISPR-associated RAMP protein Csm3 [Litorilinea aerophila]MCC9078456.1 type III-A CRISPR-associated RAMP protein Csm3 [Litorilinea aerophila]OUC07492.1 hypothetical protein RY27_14565 [Litorilinea aerophila]